MHEYFVCEEGAMGGISIVYVGASYHDAMTWVGQNGKGRNLYVYHLVFSA